MVRRTNRPDRVKIRRCWARLFGAHVLAGLLAVMVASSAMAGALVLRDIKERGMRPSEEYQTLLTQLEQAMMRAAVSGQSDISETGARHALVIGIDIYDALEPLQKAENDAHAVGESLKALGFSVTLETGLGVDAFDTVLQSFYSRLSAGDTAVFFFAGHGVADGATNYLLPADMPRLDTTESPRLARNAIDANQILGEIRARGVELALVVLDACRDDPFMHDGLRGARPITRGLARIEPEQGAFVIFSAGLGQTALDRLNATDPDPNSVFTRKFRPILETPGLPLVEIAKRTQVEVRALAETVRHPQAPAYYDEVIGQFYFQPPAPRIFGLTIGIDEYRSEKIHSLKGAVNDARLIRDALLEIGAEEVTLIVNQDARRQFISFAWQQLIARAAPGDTLVLSFAGISHSPFVTLEDDPTPVRRSMLYLTDAHWGAELGQGNGENAVMAMPDLVAQVGEVITADDFTQWMELATARNLNVVVLVDGCYAGGMLLRDFSNVTFIAATDSDGVAHETIVDGKSQGKASAAFAEGLLGAADMNKDGVITRSELFAWMDARVAVLGSNPRRAPRQRPEFSPSAASDDFVDLPLFLTPQDTNLMQLAQQRRLTLLDVLHERAHGADDLLPLHR